jgi:hypothetical protein
MKTSLDIPDRELKDALRFTKAKTKREAIVTAVMDYNRRERMAALTARQTPSRATRVYEDAWHELNDLNRFFLLCALLPPPR